ncbi:MAG: hypothetical protein P8X63_10365, partial [Desulfuromonadaceae bacterium]
MDNIIEYREIRFSHLGIENDQRGGTPGVAAGQQQAAEYQAKEEDADEYMENRSVHRRSNKIRLERQS